MGWAWGDVWGRDAGGENQKELIRLIKLKSIILALSDFLMLHSVISCKRPSCGCLYCIPKTLYYNT